LEKSREILKKNWGYDSFRPLQEDIVDSVIYGHDTLAILPTGGGKSICFQVPGIALEGITLVVSPLIALMQDQVRQLEQRNIKAALISSGLTYREIDIALDNARFGHTKFLYTSPERLTSELFIERFKRMKVGLIVVDEAHCISEWGHDFRPAYREIAAIRNWHPNAPMIALTASATTKVKEDIVQSLGLKSPKQFKGSLDRLNISYSLYKSENKIKSLLDYCKENQKETGIIYCQTRRSVKEVVTQMRAHQISAGIYHGGMSSEDRSFMLNEWLNDRLKVMVATNAFGMGIDKPNVRYVLHYELPNNIEAYYQEAGRAGRDGKSSVAKGYWNERDLEVQKQQLQAKYPEKERIKTIYNGICNFLQVAIGAGKDESYPFDISRFCNLFEIPVSEAYYSLKLLQLNGNIGFTESTFFPTRLKVLVGNKALYNFQVGHESLSPLITLLTRSYPGIFDRFIRIQETTISKRLKISSSELRKKLEALEQYGVIDVEFQSNLPKITFLRERVDEQQLTLKPEVYLKQKEREALKLDAMIDFVHSSKCRSVFISNYFGEEASPCGTCDNCLKQDWDDIMIQTEIKALLPSSLSDLQERIPVNQIEIENNIRTLMKSEQIYYEKGIYFVANNG
jgi:ATP-dependent DNA helicase RecQ